MAPTVCRVTLTRALGTHRYEYGSRAGFWRLHREFTKRFLPVTVYAVAKALEHNPSAGKVCAAAEEWCAMPDAFVRHIVTPLLRLWSMLGGKWRATATGRLLVPMSAKPGAPHCDSLVALCARSWIDYQNVPEKEEREHIRKAIEVQTAVTGVRPLGLYQGKPNAQTRRLLVEEGGFV